MMKQLTLILTLIISTLSSFAQLSPVKLSGSVTDASGKKVESATVSLLRAADSSILKYAIADRAGAFEFENVRPGSYLVSVSAAGHATVVTPPVAVTSGTVSIIVPPIIVHPQSRELAGITVLARRPFIEQKIDRTLINVDASPTNAGATALDVLEKSPGVTIDKDGNISLKGKAGVTVMMDGRPAYLTGAELANYLRNLPATAIDQIEIMTSPSSKYDASGNSGIINIKAKKNRQKGFNGSASVNYGQGIRSKLNSSLNLNYRSGRINVFANASQGLWNGMQKLDIFRKYSDASTKLVTKVFEQSSDMRNNSRSYNLKLGADYSLTQKTTIGLVTSGFINPETNSSTITSFWKSPGMNIDSILYATSTGRNRWNNGSVNLNLRHQFDSTGRELTIDLDHVRYSSARRERFMNASLNPDWSPRKEDRLRSDLPIAIAIYSGKTDYTQTLPGGAKLEAGAKGSYVETDNAANYFTVTNVGESPDYGKTNHFIYQESIYAGYLNLSRQYRKWGVQGGIRYEQTSYTGSQSGNPLKADSSFSRSYGNLFPTAFISYDLNANNKFGLSVGRRIDRPSYQDLNPFLFFLDKYTYEAGNPYLRPQFSNNIELTHTWRTILTTNLAYSRTKDMMNETFEATDSGAIVVREANLATQDAASIAVSAQIPVRTWWTASLYANVNYTRFTGMLYGEELQIDATNLTLNMNNQFRFGKGWSAELSGFYRGRGVWGQILTHPMGQLNFAVSKQVLKGKGTVKFNVRDLLYTNFPKGDLKNTGNVQAYFENRRDSRVGNLSFSYRFGKPIKGAQQRRKVGGADDEQGRVKTGGNN
ncbi:MAG: TonB-dependent receptor [Flaviaesturariibacter sp.]|nr:TonB-dependent receptor [Flaviaesturariibacter sp.]